MPGKINYKLKSSVIPTPIIAIALKYVKCGDLKTGCEKTVLYCTEINN